MTFPASWRNGNDPRLTISFWFMNYFLAVEADEPYHDLFRCMNELRARNFNTVRIESGAGLCFDASGRRRGAIPLTEPFPGHTILRQQTAFARPRNIDVLEKLLTLFRAAKEYDVAVIPSGWFYLHTFWVVSDSIREEFFSLPPERRFMRFAIDLDRLLVELEEHDLADRIAFAEIFNEFDGLLLSWHMEDVENPWHRLKEYHEEALHFLRLRHPEIRFAADTGNIRIASAENMPRDIDVWNNHFYYAWDVYMDELEGDAEREGFDFPSARNHPRVGPWLRRENPVSMAEVRAACRNNPEYDDGWYARVWLYRNFDLGRLAELECRLARRLHENFSAYCAKIDRELEYALHLRNRLFPGAALVMGEGVGYCPLPEMRWEERSEEYWHLIEYATKSLLRHDYRGGVVRTCSGPEDPSWQECVAEYRHINTLFLKGKEE